MQALADIDALIAGTQLIVRYTGYRHHGIYVGAGRVVHYAGRIRYRYGLIEEIPLAQFSGGRTVYIGHAPEEMVGAEATVRRARSRLGERRYDLLQNNCEHLCSWCQSGEALSAQVDSLTRLERSIVRVVEWAVLSVRSCPSRFAAALRLARSRSRISFADA